ncbi:TPA: hypothetical protein EYP44_02700 [Candidatus Bathyarchaeota archaeon]|nr:hypothetical protein [Candidatus Bathyarchaeota archaeon]
MLDKGSKTKLTISIDRNVVLSAKRVAAVKRMSISGLVENFLTFFSSPWAYCFRCGFRFALSEAENCPKCGWLKCPDCQACRCELSDEAAIAVFHMRKVCEDLMVER